MRKIVAAIVSSAKKHKEKKQIAAYWRELQELHEERQKNGIQLPNLSERDIRNAQFVGIIGDGTVFVSNDESGACRTVWESTYDNRWINGAERLDDFFETTLGLSCFQDITRKEIIEILKKRNMKFSDTDLFTSKNENNIKKGE